MHDDGSFVRWQTNTTAQLGYAINLIIGFATASFGYLCALARELAPHLSCREKLWFHLALIVLLLSIFFGTICVLCRLVDFRRTTKIARCRESLAKKGDTKEGIDSKLSAQRAFVRTIGKMTWVLFYVQTGAFLLGILVAGLAIWAAHIL